MERYALLILVALIVIFVSVMAWLNGRDPPD
jgi:hypothetical protein